MGRIDSVGCVPDNAERLPVDGHLSEILDVPQVDPKRRTLPEYVSTDLDVLCVGSCSGEILDARIRAITPGREFVQGHALRRTAAQLKTKAPWAVESGNQRLRYLGQ